MLCIRKIVKEKVKKSKKQSVLNESQCASVDIPDIKSLYFFSKNFPVFSKVQQCKNTF